ncbi:hypothetical protein [Arthrobacter sp. FW306-2-2C-D06B]|uniref:hypothetical protein n=1 Tax=Arthrobacter sp. FW306-2-2C-D06B TaxID=2879618 RepID=UPI001F2CA0FA|nr:hypothetical protein [Arthrobacter sp. FW306-2-2C-D06B]UKA60082.1 hypothetical protein LFT47_07005 [Arthrobacter sp. FW306-2-2C-D06B]
MNNLIFWIIVCSWLIPMGIRMYNRSRQRRLRDLPPQNYPVGYPEQPPVIFPAEPQPPVATPLPQAAPPSSAAPQTNSAPQPGSAPQGYRARKLAELDQEYSDGKIAMEDYMKLRQEIMNG